MDQPERRPTRIRAPRRVSLLSPTETRTLTALPLTYPGVGATRTGARPTGWDGLDHRADLGTGRVCFERAARAVLDWRAQLGSGVGVRASSARIHPGAVAVLRLGLGPAALSAPVRVVWTVEQPDRVGFGYGTLPGHPESGEEAFVVTIGADDRVVGTITAFSRPSSRLARLVPAATRLVQHRMAAAYLRALTPTPT